MLIEQLQTIDYLTVIVLFVLVILTIKCVIDFFIQKELENEIDRQEDRILWMLSEINTMENDEVKETRYEHFKRMRNDE